MGIISDASSSEGTMRSMVVAMDAACDALSCDADAKEISTISMSLFPIVINFMDALIGSLNRFFNDAHSAYSTLNGKSYAPDADVPFSNLPRLILEFPRKALRLIGKLWKGTSGLADLPQSFLARLAQVTHNAYSLVTQILVRVKPLYISNGTDLQAHLTKLKRDGVDCATLYSEYVTCLFFQKASKRVLSKDRNSRKKKSSAASSSSVSIGASLVPPALPFTVDYNLAQQLVPMGFSTARVQQAQIELQSNNFEAVTDWLLQHREDDGGDESQELSMALKMSLEVADTKDDGASSADAEAKAKERKLLRPKKRRRKKLQPKQDLSPR